jgi:HEAT repeat protein
MATPVDFPKYLQSLIKSYESQPDLYTLTDLQVEVRVEMPPEDPPLTPKKQPETKIERLEVLSGIRKYLREGNVLLVGKPGSGKSTVLQRFRWELAREALEDGDRPIPVLVQLRSDRSILEAICAEFRRAKLRVSAKEVDELLLDGKLLLLLDGVNEMPSQQRRQELQLFCDYNFYTPMIFTTRDLALGGSLGIEKKLEMCALTEAQMREFVGKYLPQHGDLLLRQLRNRLREIAETPLLLKMMCEVFESTGEIPQSKGELFQKFDYKYENFKGNILVSDDSRRFKSDLLQQLAFVMLQGDSQRPTDGLVAINRDRAEGILEGWLRDRGVLDAPTKAKEWLEDLLEHHLLQVAAKREEIEFHHPLFQEYYAGRALLKLLVERHDDVTDDERLQHFYLNYFKWTEPLAFMLSLLQDETQAVRVVRLALDVDWMLGARLAGEVKREFQKRAVELVDGLDVPGWLKVELLGEVRSDEAIPGLFKLAEDSDTKVRRRATGALGKIGSEVAIPGLLKLVGNPDWNVRMNAAYALGKIRSSASILTLLKLVEYSNPDVRNSAADALKIIGSNAAISGLLELLEHSDSGVRSRVAYSLCTIGGSEAMIPRLLKLLEHSNDDVRRHAANTLESIASKVAIPELLKFLEHSDSDVRVKAAKILCKNCFESAIPGLLKILEHSGSMRNRAANTLCQIGSKAAIPGLLKLAKHSDSDVRRIATNALETIGSKAATIKGLVWFDFLGPFQLFGEYNKLLEYSDSEAAIPGLLKLVKHSKSDVRRRAAEKLGNIMGLQRSIMKLIELLDSHPNVRWRVVDALGKIGSEVAIPRLIKLVEEESDSDVRWRAADALANITKQHTEGVALHLPHLLTLIPSKSGEEVHDLILTIQAACKYYNYEIRQLSLLPESSKTKNSAGQTINIDKVGNLNTGTVNITGNQIGTQHNINPKN